MTAFKFTVLLLAIAMAGCGKAEPTKPEEAKPGEKTDLAPPSPIAGPSVAGTTPGGGVAVAPTLPGPSLLEPNDPVQRAAEKFLSDLMTSGPFPPDFLNRITPAFLKVIGKPLLSDADKKLGYSADAAQAWLRRAVATLPGIGLPRGYGSPNAAVFVGSGLAGGPGRFLLRMIQAEGGWKVDWFELGTAKTAEGKSTASEGPYQDFAVLAFLDALTANASSKEDRVVLLGGVLSTKLKTAWAEPFNQDKDRGYDYSASILGKKLDELGTGVTGFSRMQAEGDTYEIELMKGDVKAAYTLKLVKGATPGEWLVQEFNKN